MKPALTREEYYRQMEGRDRPLTDSPMKTAPADAMGQSKNRYDSPLDRYIKIQDNGGRE